MRLATIHMGSKSAQLFRTLRLHGTYYLFVSIYLVKLQTTSSPQGHKCECKGGVAPPHDATSSQPAGSQVRRHRCMKVESIPYGSAHA